MPASIDVLVMESLAKEREGMGEFWVAGTPKHALDDQDQMVSLTFVRIKVAAETLTRSQ